MVVYPAVIHKRVHQELPFVSVLPPSPPFTPTYPLLPQMATENIIMALVEKGISRQAAHEEIRVLSQQAGAMVKQEGKENDLLERIKESKFFAPILPELDALTDSASFIGRSPELVEKLVVNKVKPALEPYRKEIEKIGAAELFV